MGKNHTLLVQNDEFLRILGNRMDTIEKNLESVVKGDQTSHVDGNRIDVVNGNFDERVSGMLMTRVEGKERRGVTGRSDLTLADDYTVRVKGCYTTIVGRDDAKRSYVLRVEGTGQLSSSGVMEIDADKGITLKCGKSFIKITTDKIELVAPSVSAKGEGGGIVVDNDIKPNAKGDAVLKAKSLLVKTEAASMSLKTDVQTGDSAKVGEDHPNRLDLAMSFATSTEKLSTTPTLAEFPVR